MSLLLAVTADVEGENAMQQAINFQLATKASSVINRIIRLFCNARYSIPRSDQAPGDGLQRVDLGTIHGARVTWPIRQRTDGVVQRFVGADDLLAHDNHARLGCSGY